MRSKVIKKKAGMTRFHTPSKEETRIKFFLSTLKGVFGFPTDANDKRQSKSVDCVDRNSAHITCYTLLLSVTEAIMQTSSMEGTNWSLRSSTITKTALSVHVADAKEAWDTVRTGTSVVFCRRLSY